MRLLFLLVLIAFISCVQSKKKIVENEFKPTFQNNICAESGEEDSLINLAKWYLYKFNLENALPIVEAKKVSNKLPIAQAELICERKENDADTVIYHFNIKYGAYTLDSLEYVKTDDFGIGIAFFKIENQMIPYYILTYHGLRFLSCILMPKPCGFVDVFESGKSEFEDYLIKNSDVVNAWLFNEAQRRGVFSKKL